MGSNNSDRLSTLAVIGAAFIGAGLALIGVAFRKRKRGPEPTFGPPRPKDSPMLVQDDPQSGICLFAADGWSPASVGSYISQATATADLPLVFITFDPGNGSDVSQVLTTAWTIQAQTTEGAFNICSNNCDSPALSATMMVSAPTNLFYVKSPTILTYPSAHIINYNVMANNANTPLNAASSHQSGLGIGIPQGTTADCQGR